MKKSILLTLFTIILVPTAFIPAQAQVDLVYVAVEPCRLVDTREAGGAIPADTSRNFRVSGTSGELAVQGGKSDCLDPKAGTGLKPLAISAYVIAVPATSPTSGGVLTAYPTNTPPPPVGAGSTVNFEAGQIIGNTTNITLCKGDVQGFPCPASGEFAILARSTDEHVVIDVQGYFYPATVGTCPVSAPTRFVDNGDGTICDTQTGLMWEKKDAADGVQDTANPHDVDNLYTWTGTIGGTARDGSAFALFLATLTQEAIRFPDDFNSSCFANHCDWRIPRLHELRTIVTNPCSAGPCIDPIFGPTAADIYWTSTSDTTTPTNAFIVSFSPTAFSTTNKDGGVRVRAVRGGR